MSDFVVEVLRGTVVESVHRVHVVVCRASDDACSGAAFLSAVASAKAEAAPAPSIVASAGDPDFVTFVRSAIKMFQALPLVEDGGIEHFGLTTEELAVCTASHGGEPFHVAATRSILRKAGIDEHALACGPHPPMHAASAEALARAEEPPGRIHNNCSGKHAGLLALAMLHGWPLEGYHEPHHQVQQRVVETLVKWTGVSAPDFRYATDGCGLPTFALPLSAVAHACARFAAAAADGPASTPHLARTLPGSPTRQPRWGGFRSANRNAPARVFEAMTTRPAYVAGTGRLDTDLMRVTGGRLFAKVGAEGYYCAGAPAERIGIALKVEDGAKRASESALLATLRAIELIDDATVAALEQYARPAVLNTRGERVGEVRIRPGVRLLAFGSREERSR